MIDVPPSVRFRPPFARGPFFPSFLYCHVTCRVVSFWLTRTPTLSHMYVYVCIPHCTGRLVVPSIHPLLPLTRDIRLCTDTLHVPSSRG